MARTSFSGETYDPVDQSHQLLLVLLPPDEVSLSQRLQLSRIPFLDTSCVMSFGVQNKTELGAQFLSTKQKTDKHTEVAADIIYCWGLSAAKIESITHIEIYLVSLWHLWHSGSNVLKWHFLGYLKKQKQNTTLGWFNFCLTTTVPNLFSLSLSGLSALQVPTPDHSLKQKTSN